MARNYKYNKKGGNKKKYNNEKSLNNSTNVNPKDQAGSNQSMDNVRSNNIEWWNKSPIYPDANRIPVNIIQGLCYRNDDILPDARIIDTLGLGIDGYYAEAVPGIMTIDYIPFTGPCNKWTDAINRSWLSIFSEYAAKTSGTFQVQQADLAIIGEAANSIIVNIYEVKRVLGISNLYSNVNAYLPKALLSACGYKPESVLGRQDDIRRRLNYLIDSFNSLNLPGYTDMHLRRAQLAHNVYADEDNVRAQLYVFRSTGWYLYIDTADDISDAEHLKWIKHTNIDGRDIDLTLDYIERQINALRDSASFGLVSAAVLRAFGDRQLLYIEREAVDTITVPVYDRNMLWQISNAEFVTGVNPDSLHITCDPVANTLECLPRLTTLDTTIMENLNLFAHQRYLNSYDGDLSDEFMMEATRFKVATTAWIDSEFDPISTQTPINVCGTELLTGMTMWYNTIPNEGGPVVLQKSSTISSFEVYLGDYTQAIASVFSKLTKFRNHPLITVMVVDQPTGTAEVFHIGDLYRYTRLDYAALEGLHEAALQSIYTLKPNLTIGNKQ